MQRKNQQLKKEEAKVEAKLKLYFEMFKYFESTDDDIVEVNSKASAADRHLQQEQLSAPLPPSVDSTGNANANASGK
ncbi:hypothetical protein KY284_036209 [Solanum tuberosum]|nr:hypothetical protein KY284_036209 [Solanum tuberosum]